METALEGAKARGVLRVFLVVRESNAAARAFYARLGFGQDGRRRNYYSDPAEDALLLSRNL
jgi:ribosomal-protein-alanine N-acetyltransferase